MFLQGWETELFGWKNKVWDVNWGEWIGIINCQSFILPFKRNKIISEYLKGRGSEESAALSSCEYTGREDAWHELGYLSTSSQPVTMRTGDMLQTHVSQKMGRQNYPQRRNWSLREEEESEITKKRPNSSENSNCQICKLETAYKCFGNLILNRSFGKSVRKHTAVDGPWGSQSLQIPAVFWSRGQGANAPCSRRAL